MKVPTHSEPPEPQSLSVEESPFGALLIPVTGDWHALKMEDVREVVAAPFVTALPTAPPSLIGVFNLRGAIVPLFDLSALLGLGAMPSYSFAVVVESKLGLAGLAASAVPEAVQLGGPAGGTETLGTTASFTIDTRIATLLDLDVLFGPDRVSV